MRPGFWFGAVAAVCPLWSVLVLVFAAAIVVATEPVPAGKLPALPVDRQAAIIAFAEAGEFGPALALAAAGSAAERDTARQTIAAAQFRRSLPAAYDTAATIEDDRLRADTLRQITTTDPRGAAGGAALADFDSLLTLMKATVAPDSWDDVGGSGAAEPFPGGVFVDSAGVLKRRADAPDDRLAAVRMASAVVTTATDPRRETSLRKVSLTRLERATQLNWARGLPPSDAMLRLAGLHQVQYVFVYPASRDIVLAGPAGAWETDRDGVARHAKSQRPVLELEVLVELLRNAAARDGVFGCSITPRREHLAAVQALLAESSGSPLKPGRRESWLAELRERLGRQDIAVHGVDPRGPVARIIVEADHHMKLIGMGLEPGVPGLVSYLDAVAELPAEQRADTAVLRWWFTLNELALRANPDRTAVELAGNSVRVLSENELLTPTGERLHTGAADRPNQEFAHQFTTRFPQLADRYAVYARLRHVFDLAVVAALARHMGLGQRTAWRQLHFGVDAPFAVRLGTAPTSVATVMNHRLADRRSFVVGVSGGVQVAAGDFIRGADLQPDAYGLLQVRQQDAAPDDRDFQHWWWD